MEGEHEDKPKRLAALICPNCGKTFHQRKRSVKETPLQFCTTECRFTWGNQKADALLQAGTPLATVTESEVICNLCDKRLRSAGCHFTRCHGLDPTKGKFAAERNLLYGLPYGSRLTPAATRSKLSDNATTKAFHLRLDKTKVHEPQSVERTREAARLRRHFATTPEHLEHLTVQRALAAQANHVKWCVTLTCPQCGESYQTTRGTHQRKTCGKRACVSARLSSKKTRGALQAYTCAGCGIQATGYRSQRSRYCSKACYHKNYHTRKQHAT